MEYTDLSNDDYRNILTLYDIPIPKASDELKRLAESIMAKKLCGCIKKVGKGKDGKTEGRAIGICTKSIFTRKQLSRGKFKCRKRGRTTVAMKKMAPKKSANKKDKKGIRRTMRRK